MNTREKIGIIGFGRFGKLLTEIFQNDFDVGIYDSQNTNIDPDFSSTLDELLSSISTLFIAVPIRQFASTIQEVSSKLAPSTVIIDLCSVKIYPDKIMQQYLPKHIDYFATHPLFGPDSYQAKFPLKWMMYPSRNKNNTYVKWRNYFESKGIKIIEMTPDEHDKQAAYTQGITHFLGRVLQQCDLQCTSIDTLGFQSLMKIIELTCNDSWELFYDLHNFNPYSKSMIYDFNNAVKKIESALLEK